MAAASSEAIGGGDVGVPLRVWLLTNHTTMPPPPSAVLRRSSTDSLKHEDKKHRSETPEEVPETPEDELQEEKEGQVAPIPLEIPQSSPSKKDSYQYLDLKKFKSTGDKVLRALAKPSYKKWPLPDLEEFLEEDEVLWELLARRD